MPTQLNAGSSLLDRASTFWCVAALIAVLFAATNLPWTLDDYDQAKQAFTSFEMVNQGHWLYQHTPNEKVATKPPLVGWVAAATYGIVRNWEIAWRLPSFAAAITLAVVLARAAASGYGPAAGLIAMSAFGLNLLSSRIATLVRTDMPLALVIFLTGLVIWRKLRAATPWHTRERVVVFALLTAAMLIKGPIVYAFLLPGIAAFELWRRKSHHAVSAWCGWWPWVASLAVFLVWAGAGVAWVPGFYEQVAVREFAGRFGGAVHRSQPIYFYLPHLLHKFAPWSILGIALGALAWRMNKERGSQPARQAPAEIVWLICWAAGALIFMSLIPSKRVDRIFPIVPPLCLLVASAVAHLRDREATARRVRRWTTAALFFACFFTTAYAAQRVVRSYRAGDAALVHFGAEVRRVAAAKAWRYEVVGGREEGLLLYLRRSRFLKPAEAVERWNGGKLDALVAAAEEAPALLAQLEAASVFTRRSLTVNGAPRDYVAITRSETRTPPQSH